MPHKSLLSIARGLEKQEPRIKCFRQQLLYSSKHPPYPTPSHPTPCMRTHTLTTTNQQSSVGYLGLPPLPVLMSYFTSLY